jgi:hypothetical protein
MSFFMYHLTHDHWKTPWTFILVNPVHKKKIHSYQFALLTVHVM